MSEAFIAIVSLAVGFFLADWQADRQRIRAGKDEFISKIARLKFMLFDKGKDVGEFYGESIPILSEGVFLVLPYLKRADCRESIRARLEEYQEHHAGGKFTSACFLSVAANEKKFGGDEAGMKKYLNTLLDKFEELAS